MSSPFGPGFRSTGRGSFTNFRLAKEGLLCFFQSQSARASAEVTSRNTLTVAMSDDAVVSSERDKS